MKWRWKNRRAWEQRMQAEFDAHVEHRVADLMREGLGRSEAEERALQEFGPLELTKEECRDARAFEPVDRTVREVRQAVHSLARVPGYCITAILTLALGIGANTAIFTAVEGVILKPLPYREPDRLVMALLYNRSLKHPTEASYADFLDWQHEARAFEQVAAFTPAGFDLNQPGVPQHVDGYEVSSNLFSTLGVTFAAGGSFSADSDQVGGPPAVVISNRLWRERFASDPQAIGRDVILNGEAFTISGVLGPDFHFDNSTADVYTPLGRSSSAFREDRSVHNIICIGRLRDGFNVEQARSAMSALQEQIDEQHPATERGQDAYLLPLKQQVMGDVADTLVLLLAAVALVLLIACANVANLLLARSAVRGREFAVRKALGASQLQIIRQLVTESMLLSLVGGLAGLLVAKLALMGMLAAIPGGLPRAQEIAVNAPVLLFAFAVSILAGILFATVPALKYARTDVQAGLRAGGRSATVRHGLAQSSLVVAQMALALVLLAGAGLLFRSMLNLWAVNPGFDTRQVVSFQVGLAPEMTQNPNATRAAYDLLINRIRQIPGVEAAAMSALLPLGHTYNSGPFWIGPHRPPVSMAQIPRATYYPTSPDYPNVMQIPLVMGRMLQRSDDVHSPLVILVDTLMARQYFNGHNPVGETITIPHWGAQQNVLARIVGVVGHVKQYGLDSSRNSEAPAIYFSLYQLPDDALPVFRNEINFVVRTPLSPAALRPSIARAVESIAGAEPVYNVQTAHDLVYASLSRQRFPMILLVAFALSAVLLSTVGVYGLISFWTAQRAREIGVRMALGAAKRNVLLALVAEGFKLAVAGIVIGGLGAFVAVRLLSSFSRLLYGVRTTDALTFAAVSLCLLGAALAASYLPARRAARLDPAVVLRQD